MTSADGGGAGQASLSQTVREALLGRDGVREVAVARGFEYRRRGHLFAALGLDALEVDLGVEIARAAVRTPDTAPSDRGAGWVRFAPARMDRLARDRAIAWVEVAWRRAAGGRAGPG
jgi:hypothetical protein